MITDLDKHPLRLVKGGHPSTRSVNRCQEREDELEYVCVLFPYFQVETVLEQLKSLAEDNINIVGTRGYVYRTESLLRLVGLIKPLLPVQWNLFPRAGGLREALMILHKADLTDGWL